ncbi:hypothetical protein JZ751_022801 [Albula glossodonta]|uniref:Beta/gamma crystallin 'Greek key' domain-containing protein n=1 Tax=Albula glossodonta TaxID=121402 RepID=A0A8T2PHA2_9TELE|nr:hypothetical protein JZ751_022801 [Albula glossodonta]
MKAVPGVIRTGEPSDGDSLPALAFSTFAKVSLQRSSSRPVFSASCSCCIDNDWPSFFLCTAHRECCVLGGDRRRVLVTMVFLLDSLNVGRYKAVLLLSAAGNMDVGTLCVRRSWLLYRDPGFRGPCVVLEEGEKVLSQAGGLFCPESNSTAVNIGSIRRVVKDHSTPEILIHTRDAQGLAPERFSAAVDNLGKHGPIHPSSLTVSCGCWVAYDGTGFSGNYAVLEAGGSVTPGPNNQSISCVKSLRPLRMGGLKVLRPMDPKMVVYEQPCFKGQSRELGDNTLNLAVQQGLLGAASVRVLGGVWVGYSSEGYKGHQYLLEEGEYRDCLELGGSDQALLSFRFLQADFLEPSISLLSGQDLPEAKETDVTDLDIQDLEQAGSAEKTVSILVRSGVWVAYSERSFCGKQYVLEKGTYTGDLDWGSSSGAPVSIRPIRMLRAYSQPYYQGDSKEYNAEVQDRIPIVPLSFRGCAGNQFVLGEGLYPDLISCGCVAASIKSLKPIPYRFSDPSISLFSLDSFEGQETVVVTSRESMNNFLTQSLQVNSGLWVVYEYGHFKGRRMLLHPGRIFAWGDHSGWDTIGSLHPLKPPKSYMRVRSRAVGSVLTADILMDEAPPAKVCLRPAQGLDTQHWVFTGGLLKCKVSKACLSVIGGKALPGARVALWPEHGRTHQKWSLNENGTISSHLNHNLVLDFRGGKGFEKDHLVVSDTGTLRWRRALHPGTEAAQADGRGQVEEAAGASVDSWAPKGPSRCQGTGKLPERLKDLTCAGPDVQLPPPSPGMMAESSCRYGGSLFDTKSRFMPVGRSSCCPCSILSARALMKDDSCLACDVMSWTADALLWLQAVFTGQGNCGLIEAPVFLPFQLQDEDLWSG